MEEGEKRKGSVLKIGVELIPNLTGYLDGAILLKLRCLQIYVGLLDFLLPLRTPNFKTHAY